MKRSEIARKFDEIVTFASVEKFLDTPVKHYSSGMYMRLAFSIAAHMDPDILIIDEVLAVGDTEFQEKCLGKMNQISKEEGRTVLFVSHNLLTIQKLCKKCLLLENGSVKMIGETNDVINAYTEIKDGAATNTYHKKVEASVIQYARVTNIKDSETIKSNDKLKVVVRYQSRDNKPIHDGRIVLTITNIMTQQIAVMLDSHVSALTWTEELPASGEITTETDTINLSEGEYSMNIDFMTQGSRIEYIKNALDFNVVTELSEYDYKNYPDNFSSHHLVKHHFKVQG